MSFSFGRDILILGRVCFKLAMTAWFVNLLLKVSSLYFKAAPLSFMLIIKNKKKITQVT